MIPNNRNLVALAALCFVGLFFFGCMTTQQNQSATNVSVANQSENATVNATIANPASVYCINHGGNLTIVTNSDGSQSGMCVFSNGSQCEEWSYFRGECPSVNQSTNATNASTLSKLNDSDFMIMDNSMPNVFSNEQAMDIQTPQ